MTGTRTCAGISDSTEDREEEGLDEAGTDGCGDDDSAEDCDTDPETSEALAEREGASTGVPSSLTRLKNRLQETTTRLGLEERLEDDGVLPPMEGRPVDGSGYMIPVSLSRKTSMCMIKDRPSSRRYLMKGSETHK